MAKLNKGDNAPDWGGILNVSFFVRNISQTTLYLVRLRLAAFDAAQPFPGSDAGWHEWGLDLGRPDGLEPGEKTYVLYTRAWGMCSPLTTGRGIGRFIVMPEAAEGSRGFAWRKEGLRSMRPMALPPDVRPLLIARSGIDPANRSSGTSACASLRQQALAGCPFGLDAFQCLAPPQGEPRVVESRCADFDTVERWRQHRQDPNWCRSWK